MTFLTFIFKFLQNKQGALEPDDRCSGLQRVEDIHGDELTTL
jgi:hypothetical protein